MGYRNNNSKNRNNRNWSKTFSNKKKTQEVTDYKPNVRDTKGRKKTTEATNLDRKMYIEID